MCLKFKWNIEIRTGFNLFTQMMIALDCNQNLRKNQLEANTIASELLHRWCLNTNHSKVLMEKLMWKERHLQGPDTTAAALPQIQHTKNHKEFSIPGNRYTMDGYNTTTCTIFKFQECFLFALVSHLPSTTSHCLLLDRTMEDIYCETQTKIAFLRDWDRIVMAVWECEWIQIKHKDLELHV